MVRTEVNPELKSLLPRSITIRDMAHRTTQNAILKAAYGVASMINSVFTVPDLTAQSTRQALVDTGAMVMKCLAYGSAKTNQTRRLALKPQLSKRFRNLCDFKQASHAYLLGADLTKSVQELTEASKLSSHIAVQRRR